MCDDLTEIENQNYLRRRISRREVGAGAGATFAAMWAGCVAPQASGTPPRATPPATSEPGVEEPSAPSAGAEGPVKPVASPAVTARMVTVDTPDGSAEAFFVTPPRGPHPGVLVWPDIAGLREAFQTMATRLAGEGYAVLVVNPYYRSSAWSVFKTFDEWRTNEGREKVGPMREALTADAVGRDAVAFLSWLDRQDAVAQNRKLAATGYCMTGSFTFHAAAAVPERVGAIASFHGGGLVTKEPTSPHLAFSKMKAAALICIAQNDDERDPNAKDALRRAAAAAEVAAEVNVYPAQHGFCVLDSPVYDEAQAERAWARMLETFARTL